MTKVMLVDDDASMQVLIEQIVRRGGYDFCCAGNGADGLEMLRAERPDFLILDVMLPDINGFEICEIVRGEGREVPIPCFSRPRATLSTKSIGFKAGARRLPCEALPAEELLLAAERAFAPSENAIASASMRDATAVRGVLGRGFGDTLREVRGSNARRSRGAVLPGDRAFRAARLRSGRRVTAIRSSRRFGEARRLPTPTPSPSWCVRSARR